jgi:sn-glycerol 3-phosphate transport system ATP-binding protein
MGSAIILSNVSKLYRGGVEAVRDVSLEIPAGAFCALVGPTGSGKSTLLRLIASREAPTGGLIEVGDAASQSWRIGRSEVAELVDARALNPDRNLWDNMVAGLKARGLGRKEREAAALKAADAMALGGLLARKPGSISSGEAARVALGRAFAHQPRALLFDEPFAGLDPARRLELRRALKRLQRDSGATAVIATHDLGDALALADLVAVMDRGRLVASGTPDEIYGRPPAVDIARLLGAPPMNILPVRANQTGLSLEDGTHLGAASVMTRAVFAQFGIRPEDLFVVGEGAPPAAAILPVRVEEVERAGPESLVYGRVGAFPVAARITGVAEAPADGPLRLGARRESLHMFDAETGARL